MVPVVTMVVLVLMYVGQMGIVVGKESMILGVVLGVGAMGFIVVSPWKKQNNRRLPSNDQNEDNSDY